MVTFLYRTLIIALFLCFSNSILAQEKGELISKLKTAGKDTVRCNLLLNLANQTFRNNPDSAELLCQQGLNLSKELNFHYGEIKFLNLLGNIAQNRSEYDKAQALFEKCIELGEEYEIPDAWINAQNNIGINYTRLGKFPEAIEAYRQGLQGELERGNRKGAAESYLNIGVAHYYLGDYDKTLDLFRKSLNISEEINDSINVNRVANNIGVIHLTFKRFDSAAYYYQKSIDLAKATNNSYQLAQSYHNMSTVYTEAKDFEKAVEYSTKAAEIEKALNEHHGLVISYMNIAKIKMSAGKLRGVLEWLDKAQDLANKHGMLENQRQVYIHYTDYYKLKGDFKKAIEMKEMEMTLQDSILSVEKIKAVEEFEIKYETAEKERQLALEQIKSDSLALANAKTEKEKAKIAKEKAESDRDAALKSRWIIGLILGLIVLALMAFLLIQRNKRKAEREKSKAVLLEKDKGLKAVLNAQEKERKRISKDLHDGIGQQLSGIKLAWQKLSSNIANEQPELYQDLIKMSAVVDETAEEVRSISHQMMPQSLQSFGLPSAIEEMLDKSLKYTGIEHEFESFNIEDRYPEELEINLYRVVQELINNMIKHSGASKVQVQLYQNAKQLICLVEDNGVGMEINQDAKGHGMTNIQTRLEAVNGEINIESQKGKGSTFMVKLKV